MRKRVLATYLATAALAAGASTAASGAAWAGSPAGAHAVASDAPGFPGVYLSPWGSAHLAFSPEFQAQLAKHGASVSAIAPVTVDEDGKGAQMPIGAANGDHLDAKGRIYYPGGLVLNYPKQRTKVTLSPLYIRFTPPPVLDWSSPITIEQDGKDPVKLPDTVIAKSSYADVFAAGGTPTLTGFQVNAIPFRLSPDASALIKKYTGFNVPAGLPMGTLQPTFDYVPTSANPIPSPLPGV